MECGARRMASNNSRWESAWRKEGQRGKKGVNESNPSSVSNEQIRSETKWYNRIRLDSYKASPTSMMNNKIVIY